MGEEGRRFLRYIMPGLVYGVETLLFILIVLPEPTLCFLSKVISKEALGTSIVAFFASGALGYIFASIHHFVHWLPWYPSFEKGIFDHEEVIKVLPHENLITQSGFDIEKRIQQYKAEKKSINKRMIAESISLSLWYHFEKDTHLGKAGIDNLGHQAHSLGTARIATFFAILTTLVIIAYVTDGDIKNSSLWIRCASIFIVILGVIIIMMFHKAYRRVAFFAHEPYTIILQNECAQKIPSSSVKDSGNSEQ